MGGKSVLIRILYFFLEDKSGPSQTEPKTLQKMVNRENQTGETLPPLPPLVNSFAFLR